MSCKTSRLSASPASPKLSLLPGLHCEIIVDHPAVFPPKPRLAGEGDRERAVSQGGLALFHTAAAVSVVSHES